MQGDHGCLKDSKPGGLFAGTRRSDEVEQRLPWLVRVAPRGTDLPPVIAGWETADDELRTASRNKLKSVSFFSRLQPDLGLLLDGGDHWRGSIFAFIV